MRRPIALAGIGLALALAGAASAQPSPSSPPPPVVASRGVAIQGYDPVAYHLQGRAVPGSPEFEHGWNGAVWRFASAAARDRFAADPAAYAPRYGGWCAFAMSEGRLAPGDPRVWRIVGGRLYLNCSAAAQRRWEADLQANIARADAHWARLTANAPR